MLKRFCPLTCTIWLWLSALIVQPIAFAKGRVEHHQMTSKILADAGQPADRELSIYLPEEYDASELAYPVLYLIHGASGTCNPVIASNQLWFAYGADAVFDQASKPLIIVMPSMGVCNRVEYIEDNYLIREIIPFVNEKYRTIPNREGHAISGSSRGGRDALRLALSHPELFSVVGGISSSGGAGRKLLEAHPQEFFPLQFYLAYGRNEEYGITDLNRESVKVLEELGFPYAYAEDNGSHFDAGAYGPRVLGTLEFVSKILGGGIVITSVELNGKLPNIWAEVKVNK